MRAFSKRVMILMMIALATLISCTRRPKAQKDQISYTIGVQFGKSLKSQNLDIDPKMVGQGIEDALTAKKIELTDEEMQAAMMRLSDDRQRDQKSEAEKNKVKSDEFLAKNKLAPGIKTTPSGLQYNITQEGTGESPKNDDIVVVNYKGTLIDGTEFDSSYKRKQAAEFPVKGVIPGWTEGLQLLKKGGKAMLYVPPELGYGDRPRQQIPSNAVLIFEVELVDVKSPPKASGSPAKPTTAKKK